MIKRRFQISLGNSQCLFATSVMGPGNIATDWLADWTNDDIAFSA
jgi:hypothetical protein